MKMSFQRAGLFILVELRSPVKPGMTYQLWMPDQVGHDVCVGMTYDCWRSPVKPGMTYGTGKTMLLSDAKILEDVPQNFIGGDVAGD